MSTIQINEEKLMGFVGKVIGDFGAALTVSLSAVGDELGLFQAMAAAGERGVTSQELADATKTAERYVREWLLHMATAQYVDYAPATGRYTLPIEHAVALTHEDSPAYMPGGFQVVTGLVQSQDRIRENFKTGKGLLWGEHHRSVFSGTERFFRPGYVANLVSSWLPSLDGVVKKLEAGARVADVGCGHGASAILMAKAYPKLRIVGFDSHAASIERARKAAAEAGLSDRVTFEVAMATEYPRGEGFDLVCFFDCLHDMGKPTEALRHTRECLRDDGTIMIIEPMAGEKVEENLNPVGRVYSGASAMCCTANAIATGHTHLGTVVPESTWKKIAGEAGLTRFRRATETMTNRVFEVRR
jgi:2-polyprenyl-3-methyl-5-hydroxy-6-metoxy-1,4-benzoquinol methylase